MSGARPELGSAAFSQRSASSAWQQLLTSSPANARNEHARIDGNVAAVLFDFDGTLTATPGDRSERKYKIAELVERAPLLEPWLRCLRSASITVGIISKSSRDTIVTALEKAGLRELFDGPIVAKAVGFEGKAGFIEELCRQGALSHLGSEGARRVLLVDDDIQELSRARDVAIQTYPAPMDGGLQYSDFHRIFLALGLQEPPRPAESKEICRLWTYGMTGQSLGLGTEVTQMTYPPDKAPLFSEYYEMVENGVHLGQGAFGVCARGVHVATRTSCAVKLMRKEVVGRHYLETFVEQDMFTFLLKMARWESHPNVVRHLDYLLGPTVIYAAMELLEGADLDTHLQLNAPITESFAQRIMRQVIMALAHIHVVSNVGLIHRDVKLENLRFRGKDENSSLVLVDFGLCCPARPEQKRGIVGTLLYMAPEIFTAHYTTQVDLWSAGVLLYIILTGKPPWKQALSTGMCPNRKISNGTAVKAALDASEVEAAPALAVELLKGLLVVDPQERLTAAAAGAHAWLSDGTTSATPVINVDKNEYVSVHEYTLQTPKAKLDLMVSMNESDGGNLSGGALSPTSTEQPERFAGQPLLASCRSCPLPPQGGRPHPLGVL